MLFFLLFIMQGTAVSCPRARVLGWGEMALGTVGDLGEVPTGKPFPGPALSPGFSHPGAVPEVHPTGTLPTGPPGIATGKLGVKGCSPSEPGVGRGHQKRKQREKNFTGGSGRSHARGGEAEILPPAVGLVPATRLRS